MRVSTRESCEESKDGLYTEGDAEKKRIFYENRSKTTFCRPRS